MLAHIVLVSSARGLLGHPAGYTAYCASKSAIDGITKALGCELGNLGITVNAIAPTVFKSPLTAWMVENTPEAKKFRSGFITRVPKGRLGIPEDLAGPLLFLSSKASDFYTGHINSNFQKPIIPQKYFSSWAQYSLLATSMEERLKIMSIPVKLYHILQKPFFLQI